MGVKYTNVKLLFGIVLLSGILYFAWVFFEGDKESVSDYGYVINKSDIRSDVKKRNIIPPKEGFSAHIHDNDIEKKFIDLLNKNSIEYKFIEVDNKTWIQWGEHDDAIAQRLFDEALEGRTIENRD